MNENKDLAGAPPASQDRATEASPQASTGLGHSVGIAGARPSLAVRVSQFSDALAAMPPIAERLAAGQQFNVYERGEEDEDDDAEFLLCVGPSSDALFVCNIVGRARAEMVEAALKVATEALREAPPPTLLEALQLCVIRDPSLKFNAGVMAALARAHGEQQ